MHCSSAGEFEQGKPIVEALKAEYPHYKILVSFFSPSGYAVAQHYVYADYVTYLPLDTRKNAERFLKTVRPELAIFVKYEFWYHHLHAGAFRHLPLLLVSAVFRKDQIFFKGHGRFFRQMLMFFRHIFVQDEASLQLLKTAGITASSVSGDTRFDRVKEVRSGFREVEFIRDFVADKKVIVAGSTWEADESLLAQYTSKHAEVKLIIAPHEISATHLARLQSLFGDVYLYSLTTQQHSIFPLPNSTGSGGVEINKDDTADLHQSFLQKAQVLIIDSVGLLSRLYNYADVTYVGGGFSKDGIHNILEAAVWGKPVIFGPNYKKYREAAELIAADCGFSTANANDLNSLLDRLFSDQQYLRITGAKAEKYVEENTGATEKLLQAIQEKRLLTRL
jgi:3-deoxy-D-manno-octulosonic-acid transferase